MRILILACLLLCFLLVPVSAEWTAPDISSDLQAAMPEPDKPFLQSVLEMVRKAIGAVRPDLREAAALGTGVVAAAIAVSLVQSVGDGLKPMAELTGTACVTGLLLHSSHSLVMLGMDMISRLNEYARLLLPVMTASLAAGGSAGTAAALYMGTTAFGALLTGLIHDLLLPLVYLYLAAAAAAAAVGESMLKKLKDRIRNLVHWFLRSLMVLYTSAISITGVVSGATDAAAAKAVKAAISTAVPVIGGTLAQASEAFLVSAQLAKNAAGIYGIYAMLAVFLAPFLRIGSHYLILKASSALCGMFEAKRMTELTEDFSAAMGILLAVTGSICMMQLISVVCFLKGGLT